ncbi:MAG: hypothetical protein J6I53_13030 [Treponema sp.]|uniref:hypothetical protein n=1 Tax=Treponema sp. TaxID=166 RepID=UPI001B6EAF63|nr:hypothetical protein [Treponema sp.]MBP3773590.1 hypothetical protein [Treponema sp.]MBQ9282095.1 hypothetical protein [Treponema sp.]
MTSSKSVVFDRTFSPRVMELRKKIHDAEYVDFAVQRIAQVLSRKIVEDSEQQSMRRRHESK